MKAFAGILLLVSMIMNTIIGYNMVSEVLPTWMTFWAVSTTLTYAGFIGSIVAEAMKD